MTRHYEWTRFWCPRGESITVTDEGYLFDPQSDYGVSLNQRAQPLTSLLSKPCLILLGEAGIGKSTEMKFLQTGSDEELPTQPLRLDLGEYGDEASLRRDLFESEDYQSWKNGPDILTIVLDSLDEAILEMPKIIFALERGLRNAPIERLRLRIASRTAAWPESLSESLKLFFGEEGLGLYELCPLRRKDIELAANDNNLDAAAFIDEIESRYAGPLAANPTSLRFLLNIFHKEQQLPVSLCDLYEQGLTLLCTPSVERADRRKPGDLNTKQILQIASRIAAMLIYTKSMAIVTSPESDLPSGDLPDSTVSGGDEVTDGIRFHVTPDNVRLALADTGLFTSRGPRRVGFAHKTYGEYLAARYLYHRHVPQAQLRSLFYLPDEDSPHLIPQLHEVAAWLASFDNGLFEEIARYEPEVLLLSDVSTRSIDAIPRLVTKLLERVDRSELSWNQIHGIQHHLRRLMHDGLAKQLHEFILDSNLRPDTRRLAIDIAEAAQLRELAVEIADVALDPSVEHGLRDTAAHAVLNLEDPCAYQKLKPLALGQAGDDPDDQLRGCGLTATWPAYLSIDELLQSLTPPIRQHFFGAYGYFLYSGKVVNTIEVEDLPKALAWATNLHSHGSPVDELAKLAGQLAYRALEYLDDDAISTPLSKLVFKRLTDGAHNVFIPTKRHGAKVRLGEEEPDFQLDDNTRRRLLELLVALPEISERNIYMLYSDMKLIHINDDIAWFFDKSASSPETESRKWAHLAVSIFNRTKLEHVVLWLQYQEICPTIAQIFGCPAQVDLDSTQARKMKAEYLKRCRWDERITQRRSLPSPPNVSASEHVRIVLDRCLKGEPELFWWLLQHLQVDSDSIHHSVILPETVYDHPDWKATDQTVQSQIIEAARRYLRDVKLNADDLYQRIERYQADRALALAVELLFNEDVAFLNSLSPERWAKIGSYLLYVPVGNMEVRRKLVEIACHYAPGAMRDATIRIVNSTCKLHNISEVASLMENCLDPTLSRYLLEILKEERCDTDQYGEILGWLLRHSAEGVIEYAESIMRPPRLTSKSWPRHSNVVAIMLISCSPDAGWQIVWPLIDKHLHFGKHVLQGFVTRYERRSTELINKLNEPQLEQLLHWLLVHYPPSEDPDYGGAHWVNPDDEMRQWRDTVLMHLQGRGTAAACVSIRNLRDIHIEYVWLQNMYLEAQRVRRRESWMPPSPREFLDLVRSSSYRFVSSPAQLLDLIVESLDRYAQELHGSTPSRTNLWDKSPRGKWQPADEGHFSDDIKRHLERDLAQRGVVVNREVQIRQRTSKTGAAGQRTDIQVDAVSRSPESDVQSILTVIVEVKGCWNPEVQAAMKTQLVDRYLHENQCQHGLYLVAWFLCDQWNKSDKRKSQVPWATLNDARDELTSQAKSVSEESTVRAYVMDCALR